MFLCLLTVSGETTEEKSLDFMELVFHNFGKARELYDTTRAQTPVKTNPTNKRSTDKPKRKYVCIKTLTTIKRAMHARIKGNLQERSENNIIFTLFYPTTSLIFHQVHPYSTGRNETVVLPSKRKQRQQAKFRQTHKMSAQEHHP